MNIFQWGETRGYKGSDSQYKNYISCINFNNTTFLPVIVIVAAAVAAKSLQSCPTLRNPREGSPPGSPVSGILQARIQKKLLYDDKNINTTEHISKTTWDQTKCELLVYNYNSLIL